MVCIFIMLFYFSFYFFVWNWENAPEGWEDENGFHYGKKKE